MSCILALETSGTICSVALLQGDEVIQRVCETPRQHMQHLLPFADALLDEAGMNLSDLDAIGFSRGPGSFTGLRIAAAAAQGLAFGSELPVVPVSTLQTLAQTAFRETGAEQVLTVLDARMNEVYSAGFTLQDGLMFGSGSERLSAREQVSWDGPDPVAALLGAGSGWNLLEAFPAELRTRVRDLRAELEPMARDVCTLAAAALSRGEICAPVDAQPVYIRDKVAEVPKPRPAN